MIRFPRNTPFRFFSILLISLFTLLPCAGLFASEVMNARDVLTIDALMTPVSVRQGESCRVELRLSIQPDWYIYSVIPSEDEDAPPPSRIDLNHHAFSKDGPAYETRPKHKFVDVLDVEIYYHKSNAVIYQNLRFTPSEEMIKNGELEVTLAYQACTDTICLPGTEQTVQIPFTTELGDARDEYRIANRTIDEISDLPERQEIHGLVSQGFWPFVALAALMGLFSLLTPCVFPMIPITITYFSKQSEGKHGQVLKLAVIFAGGIIFTYTVIGVLISALFGAGSALRLASNPVVNLIIAIVFIVFAFSLIGVINLSLPPSIENYFDTKARKLGGVAGVLLMGLTFTLTAFTCTVQFVGTMLIAAAHGDWLWPVIGMLVFSTVFSMPFFLLALAPGMVNKVRGKSGEWMGRAKVVLGILELMASVKFLSNADLVWQTNLISRNLAIAVWIVLVIGIIIYLTWTAIRPKLNRSPIQWAIIIIFSLSIVGMVKGWNGGSLGGLIDAVLPPVSVIPSDSKISAQEVKWMDSYEAALIRSKKENKPVFIEFTGYTCVNCRWMEQNTLAEKEVQAVLNSGFVLLKLYTDGGNDGKKNLQLQIDRFKTVALPYYAIISPDSQILRTTSGIIREKETFMEFLRGE